MAWQVAARACAGQLSGHREQSAFAEEGNSTERTNQLFREGRQKHSHGARNIFATVTKAHEYTGNEDGAKQKVLLSLMHSHCLMHSSSLPKMWKEQRSAHILSRRSKCDGWEQPGDRLGSTSQPTFIFLGYWPRHQKGREARPDIPLPVMERVAHRFSSPLVLLLLQV